MLPYSERYYDSLRMLGRIYKPKATPALGLYYYIP